MLRSILFCVFAMTMGHSILAETLRVPQDFQTIQVAIDHANAGDIVLVAPGRYSEHIRLKPDISLRSSGDDTAGVEGLRRAEETIIDGGHQDDASAVSMAEGSTLNGFTITNVGTYDDAKWLQHYESQGEELGDDEGSVQAEGTTPAISVRGVSCTVTNCIIHHNGDVGIGVLGEEGTKTEALITANVVYRNMGGGIGIAEEAQPIVRGNICRENLRAGIGCRKASPVITDNLCFQNIRAGIGCREGSMPILRGNKCYQNRRAGIGIRMNNTAPVVDANECFENEMAGIGCRDGASPILRNNVCRKNKMAGIGSHGALPLIVGNVCQENQQAGIGLQGQTRAVIQKNQCHDNRLVAIGVTEESMATIIDNKVSRTGGLPPIIAVKDASTATIQDNQVSGGGVAAILIQGKAIVSGNTFAGIAASQGNAVWVLQNSTAAITENSFHGYRTAVNASKATVTVTGNLISQFQGTAIIVKDSQNPAHVHGNKASSTDTAAQVTDVQGLSGIVEHNVMTKDSLNQQQKTN